MSLVASAAWLSQALVQRGFVSFSKLMASSMRRFYAGDLDFEAAVVGVVVFADAVGEVDAAALERVPVRRRERPCPSPRRGWRRSCRMPQRFCAEAWASSRRMWRSFMRRSGADQANVAGDKDGLGVAVAQRFQLAQPAGQHRRNAVQGQLGMDAQEALGLAGGQALLGIEAEAALEFGQRGGGQREAHGKGVAAEAGEEIGAAFDGVEQLKAIDGAAGAMRHAVFDADHDGGLGGALDDARGQDADDAAMPAVAIDDQQPFGGENGVCRPGGFQSR